MTEIAVIGATANAYGHPTECEEPASGEIVSTASHGISVTVNGNTHDVATVGSADVSVTSHAHSHSSEDGCGDYQSHSVSPDGEPSITINGSALCEVGNNIATDPSTGGDIDATNPVNTKITIQ